MNRTSRVVLAALVAVAATGLTSCERPAASDDGPSPVIRLATGVDPSFTPIYVAVDKGYFEDEGLQVEYFTTEGGPTMTQAVIAGEADVATQSDTTTVSLMPSAPQLRSLAAFEHSNTYIKVILGPGVNSADDIDTMAAVPGLMTLASVRYLESEGIDPDDVELIEAPPPDVPSILQNGDADATVVFEPWASRTAQESGGEIVGTIGDFDLTYEQWIVTTDSWLSANEDEAAKLMRAIEKANAFVRANPEEAADITESMIQTPADQTLRIMRELEFEVTDIDEADVAAMRDAAQFFVDSGDVKKVPDLGKQMLLGWYSEHVE